MISSNDGASDKNPIEIIGFTAPSDHVTQLFQTMNERTNLTNEDIFEINEKLLAKS